MQWLELPISEQTYMAPKMFETLKFDYAKRICSKLTQNSTGMRLPIHNAVRTHVKVVPQHVRHNVRKRTSRHARLAKNHITKTCLYNVDPLKPHFYIVKLEFTGVDIIFHISAQNIDCGYSLEPPRRGGSNEYPQSVFFEQT